MKLINESFKVDGITEVILTEHATYQGISSALDATKNMDALLLRNDRDSAISVTKINSDYHLRLYERTISGRLSISFVKETLSRDDILKAFKYFLDENYSSLANSFKWKLQPESRRSKKSREELELKLAELDAEHDKKITEIEANYQNSVNDRLEITSQISTKDSSENYSPTWLDTSSHGSVNAKLICQHCNQKGFVHTKSVSKKVGISGAKATAGLLTAGLSLFAVGLSRKDKLTEAYCANCQSIWHF